MFYFISKQKSKEYNFEHSSNNITIAHLTDFHYDAFYAEGSSDECTDFVCCRNISKVKAPLPFACGSLVRSILRFSNKLQNVFCFIRQPKENATAKANKWGSLHCDSPGNVVDNICTVVAANHKVSLTISVPTKHSEHDV